MTAAPGPQQPDEVRARLSEVLAGHLPVYGGGDSIACSGGCTAEWEPWHVAGEVLAAFAPAQSARSQVDAAKLLVEMLEEDGEPVEGQLRKLASPSAQPDEVYVELPSGGRAHVSSDAPPSLLRALDALSVAAQQATPAQPVRDTGEGRR